MTWLATELGNPTLEGETLEMALVKEAANRILWLEQSNEDLEARLATVTGEWNKKGDLCIQVAEGRQTVSLQGGTPDVLVAVQKLYQSKEGFREQIAAQSRTIERMRKVLQQVSDWCPENGPIGYVGFIARKALAGEEG
jgi:hypothetical protein